MKTLDDEDLMRLESIANDIHKLTLGSGFSFQEFKKWVDMDDRDAQGVLFNMDTHCYIEHVKPIVNGGSKFYKVVTGEKRKELINRRIKGCQEKVDMYSRIIDLLKTLKQ